MSNTDGTSEQPSQPENAAGAAARHGWRGIGPGVLLCAIACLAVYLGRDLPDGSKAQPGPGLLPHILSPALLILGIVVAIEGFFHRGPRPAAPSAAALLQAAKQIMSGEV